jgi:hypothetical protein
MNTIARLAKKKNAPFIAPVIFIPMMPLPQLFWCPNSATDSVKLQT